MNKRIFAPLPPTVVALTCILMAATGCQTYHDLPFDPQTILQEIKTDRAKIETKEKLTFADAANLMSTGNPELRELRAQYQTLKATADTPTPLPNPEIEAGPMIGHRMGDTPRSKIQPFVSLGFAIPLGPRLGREDDLNSVKAETARLAVVARHRDLFLSLRSAFVNHALAAERLKQRELLSDVNRQSTLVSRKLLDAGIIGELELNQGKILNKLAELKRIDDELEANSAAADLANLLGLSPGTVAARRVESLPQPPARLEDVEALEKALIWNNTKLSALRMAFLEHDAELKLELAKQYPDLNLGLGFEQEPGEKVQKFELGIGLELPLFDRNKQGIAQAVAARKAAKVAYEAELSRLLSALEVGAKKYTLVQHKTNALEELLPLAAKNQQDALKLTNQGTFDFMRYLDVSRAYAELAMEHVEQKSQLWAVLADLEQIVGCPMTVFPDNAANQIPTIENKMEATP